MQLVIEKNEEDNTLDVTRNATDIQVFLLSKDIINGSSLVFLYNFPLAWYCSEFPRLHRVDCVSLWRVWVINHVSEIWRRPLPDVSVFFSCLKPADQK